MQLRHLMLALFVAFFVRISVQAESEIEKFCNTSLTWSTKLLADSSYYQSILSKLTVSDQKNGQGLQVVMAAVELGAIPGLKMENGKPLDMTVGGVATVLTDIGRYYPALLEEHGNGRLTIVGMLMQNVSTAEMQPGQPVLVRVDETTTEIKTWRFQSASGANYVFLDHPRFQHFNPEAEKFYGLSYLVQVGSEKEMQEEQRTWSVFNQGIAEVFAREKGEIYLPHDHHVSPASFYIDGLRGVKPIALKPLVHNEKYTGSFLVSPQYLDRVSAIWNVSPSDFRSFFLSESGTEMSMLLPSVRLAEKNEIFSAWSVSEGTADLMNDGAGGINFGQRVGAQPNPLADEERPEKSPFLQPAPESVLVANGVTHPDAIRIFNSLGKDFQRVGPRALLGKAKAKEAIQKNFGMNVDSSKPLFLSFGRLVHQKGIPFLIKNIETILNSGGQLIIGGPAGDSEGDALRRELLLVMDHFRFRRHEKDFIFIDGMVKGNLKGLLLAAHDFFPIPSRYEPNGMTELESLAYGGIPIVHGVGGLGKGQNSILYGPTDPDHQDEALADAIHEAFDLYHQIDVFQSRELAAMREDFSIERNFDRFLLNNRIEAYGKIIRNLGQLLDHREISWIEAQQRLRTLLQSNPADLVPLIRAVAKISISAREPLQQALLDETVTKTQRFQYLRKVGNRGFLQAGHYEHQSGEVITAVKKTFTAEQGWRDFIRDENFQVVRARFRLNAKDRNRNQGNHVGYFIIGDVNQWGGDSHEMGFSRLHPSSDPNFLETDQIPVVHGMEYLIFKRELNERGQNVDTAFLDPVNPVYTTPPLLKKLRHPVHELKRSVFWDLGRPERYKPVSHRQDSRALSGGGISLAVDLNIFHGKSPEWESYNAIADSRWLIPRLAECGVRQVQLVAPGGLEVLDWRRGTPDEFARLIDVFNQNHIAVILDVEVNPLNWQDQRDLIFSRILDFGFSGASIRVAPMEAAFATELNRELHQFDPGIFTLGPEVGPSRSESAAKFSSVSQDQFSLWISENRKKTGGILDFQGLKKIVDGFYHHGLPTRSFHWDQFRSESAEELAFGSLTMLVGSEFRTTFMVHSNLLDSWWSKYWKNLERLFSSHPAFLPRNDVRSPIIHMDPGGSVLVLRREDSLTRKKLLIVINLGDSSFERGYEFGVPELGPYRLILDSASRDEPEDSNLSVNYLPQILSINYSPHINISYSRFEGAMRLKRLQPYQVLIFEYLGNP